MSKFNYGNVYRTAAQVLSPYAKKYAGQAADRVMDYYGIKQLFKQPSSARATPAKVLKQTQLKKYLDMTYQKKCGVEVKQLVTANTLAPTSTLNVGVVPFDDLNTGTLSDERVGDTIEIKKIKHKVILRNTSAASEAIRMIWVYVPKYNGSVLGANQIIQNTSNMLATYLVNEGRGVQILRDETIVLGAAGTDTSLLYKNFGLSEQKHFKSCKPVRWSDTDTTGDIAQMLEGYLALYVMATGTSAISYTYWQVAEFVDV